MTIKEQCQRYCDAHTTCDECPMFDKVGYVCPINSIMNCECEFEGIIADVRKWNDEHPANQKTYASDFFEKYPDALGYTYKGARVPAIRKCIVYGAQKCCDDCSNCWLLPVEEKDGVAK